MRKNLRLGVQIVFQSMFYTDLCLFYMKGYFLLDQG